MASSPLSIDPATRDEDIEAQGGVLSPKRRGYSFASFYKSSLLHDALAALACLILAAALEAASPRSTFVLKETLYWHSFPHKDNSVPSWSVPLYSLIGPLVLFLAHRLFFARTPWRVVLRLGVGLCLAYFLTAAITNCLKLPVGRLRPNFIAVCWPNGTAVFDRETPYGGFAVCEPGVSKSDAEEVRKSWPSGHSSLSAAGLGYTTFYLLGQLQVFAQRPGFTVEGRCWRLVLALLPGFGAVAVAITRVLDYWHYPSDVLTGLAIGFLTAFFVYRMFYPPLTDIHCDRAWEVMAMAAAAGKDKDDVDGERTQDPAVDIAAAVVYKASGGAAAGSALPYGQS